MQEIKIEREAFLQTLEATLPGIVNREIIEQTSCFAFKSGKVYSFNEEMTIRAPSALPDDFEGAVKAAPLMAVLRKMNDSAMTIEVAEKELILVGKNRRRRVGM